MFDVQTISVLTLPSVPFADRKGLPACPAIYFVLNAHGTVLYVGRSVNLAGRWGGGSQHHQTTTLTQHGATHLAWLVMDDAALLVSVEAACIAYFEPVCNAKETYALGKELVSIAARFPASLAAQIDAHLAAMRRTIPGITLGRSDALRSLVLHALEALYGPSAGGASDIITDTSTRRLLQKEKRRAREGGVTDTVTDTTVTDTAQLARRLRQEFEAFLDNMQPLVQTILHAQPVTDTVTDTEAVTVTDTVTDTAAPQKPSRRRTRQQVSA